MDHAPARFRPRTSGADRLCGAHQSGDPVALRQALRGAGIGPEPRATGRPAAAAVRHVGAGRVVARARASARATASRGYRAAFFLLGGLPRTARWAEAVAQRRIALEAGGGFRVEPPRAETREAPAAAY